MVLEREAVASDTYGYATRANQFVPEYLKMALSKNIMRNVARFRIPGHGLKCETGLYGRSPERSARVCNLCENGN